MKFTFIVEVEIERTSGKFTGREEAAEELIDAIEGANPGSVYVDETEYDVTDWSVSEAPQEKKKTKG